MSDPKHINTGVPIQDEVSDIANNGGPAFPVTNWDSSGMTLRDYFAATALQKWWYIAGNEKADAIAHGCYQYADAMLRAREAKP